MKQTNGWELFTAFLQKCQKFFVNGILNVSMIPSFVSRCSYRVKQTA